MIHLYSYGIWNFFTSLTIWNSDVDVDWNIECKGSKITVQNDEISFFIVSSI